MNKICEKIRPTIIDLKVGEAVMFPIAKMKSVRTQASELGAILDRQFTTRMDRENRVIVVARAQ
jgi:hypothetical protein